MPSRTTEPNGYTWHWSGDLIKVWSANGTFAGRVYRDQGPRGTFYRADTGSDPYRCDWSADREIARHLATPADAVSALATALAGGAVGA